jgi:hypothetical protein
MHGKRGIIEFGLGRRFVIEMVEAVGASRPFNGYDGPEILPSPTRPFCLI